MDDIGLDAPRPEPTRQPDSITAGIEDNGDAIDLASGLRLTPPAQQQFQKGVLSPSSFLRGHFNDADQHAVLFKYRDGPAAIAWFSRGALYRLVAGDKIAMLAGRPITSS